MKRMIRLALCLSILLALVACGGSDKTVVVNFDSDGGSNVNAVVFSGDKQKLSKPADPTKEGYTFVEWQLNGQPYDFNQIVDKDITLKAVWSSDSNQPSGGDSGSKGEDKPKEKVACTGLKGEYHNYWAIVGTSAFNLNVEISPEGCTDVPEYKSDDESIVTVDKNGNVNPIKIGKTTIHVTCGDQKVDLGFEVRPKTVKLEKITFGEVTVKLGESATIKPIFHPENTTEKEVTYESADGRVSVNNEGVIVGLVPGPAYVNVKGADGNTYSCKVMVEGESLVLELPLYSELSYSAGNYVPCYVTIKGYKGDKESIQDVSHFAEVHTSGGGEVELVGDMLFAHADPGEEKETTVWFTYDSYTSNKVTIYVKP